MRVASLIALGATILLPSLAQAGPDGLVGTWLTDEGDSKIKMAPCGKAFCGTIVWAKVNTPDAHNPDPAGRKRGIVGLTLTKDMRASGSGWEGSMYNPENGKTYSVTMQVKAGDKLEVGGCVLGVLCGSETWSRTTEETASAASVTLARP